MDISYIAGFFDGEGSIGIYKSFRGTYYLRTQLTQNVTTQSTKLLKSLQLEYGGNLSTQTSLSGKLKYNWQLNGKMARDFLEKMLRNLILKTDQAELAIEWFNNKPQLTRDNLGRIRRTKPHDFQHDANIAQQLKDLKR